MTGEKLALKLILCCKENKEHTVEAAKHCSPFSAVAEYD